MEELYTKLNAITDVYFDFVMGVISYVKRKPEHLNIVLQFLNNSTGLTTSDVIKFIMKQPDFHEYGSSLKETVD